MKPTQYLALGLAWPLALVAAPAAAQRAVPVEQRIERLEQQLRAVQRRVFPDGQAQFVQPEIQPDAAGVRPAASGDAMASLTARLDSLEAQLRAITGQVEEQGFRTRQVEEAVTRLRVDLSGRVERLEGARTAAVPAPAEPQPVRADPAPSQLAASEPAPAAAADGAEEAYNAGFRLWEARRYTEAQQALAAAATRYPSTRWTSWMRNLEGRAYLDDNKPATAARIFLANYTDNPRGERAADSLFFLGQALTRLNRRTEACRVYGELADVYPNMRDYIRERLPQARTDARCPSS